MMVFLRFLLVIFNYFVPILWDLFKKNPDFVIRAGETFAAAKKAETPEEKIDAAKKIQDLIAGIR